VYRPESDYGYDGAPIVRIDSFADGHIHDVASLRRVRLPPDEVTRYALREQDILINRVNSLSHIGKSAIVPVLLEPTVFESNMMRLRLKPDLLPEFLILFLCYDRARAYWLTRAKPAVNQSSINQKDVRQLHVPVPSPDEQREIVETAGANARLLETLVMRYQVLERLKRGLTQDLLTGKRRVVGDSLGTMKRQTLLRL
jgi:type I restriction enzyme S subunit